MTIPIIIITAAISILAFYKEKVMYGLMLNPYRVIHKREYHRVLSHAFLHVDWTHLIINMIVLFSFGINVERWLGVLQNNGYLNRPLLSYAALYFGGIVISTLITLFRNRNKPSYNSVGASGAVSAVVFTSIFFAPLDRLYFFGILPIPGILFAILYLLYSSYMSRRSRDNVNHDAHLMGALFGFAFPLFIDFQLLEHFISQF